MYFATSKGFSDLGYLRKYLGKLIGELQKTYSALSIDQSDDENTKKSSKSKKNEDEDEDSGDEGEKIVVEEDNTDVSDSEDEKPKVKKSVPKKKK
jgi:hypothetical protein